MSSYEEMARERKRARVPFLELRAEGFEFLTQKSPEDPLGYVVGVEGPACSERLLERIKANKPGLLKILLHRCDPDLEGFNEKERCERGEAWGVARVGSRGMGAGGYRWRRDYLAKPGGW